MFQFKRNDTVESKFVFLDGQTNEPLDIVNAQYRIVYYTNNQEMILVDETPLVKVPTRTGEYLVTYVIPPDAIENETYYIYATGNHPIDGSNSILEDQFRVISPSFFGKSTQLNIQFTTTGCVDTSENQEPTAPSDDCPDSGLNVTIGSGISPIL